MTTRATYGPLSFEMPEGFVDDTTVAIAKPLRMVDGKPTDPDGYPLNLTITRDKVGSAPDPLRYLQVKLGQLRPALQQYKQGLVEATTVNEHPAARAQFSFVAHFALEQLVLVWFAHDDLVTATLTTTELGVEQGWQVISQVAASVELERR